MRLLAILGAVLGLAGCTFATHAPGRIPESKRLAQPVSLEAPGPLFHGPSGFEFAERYGPFRRVAAERRDELGLDLTVGYDAGLPDCSVATRVAVYPTPHRGLDRKSVRQRSGVEEAWLKQQFRDSRNELRRAHPALEEPVETTTSVAAVGSDLEARSFRFREGDRLSELDLFVYAHRWFVERRASYPHHCEAEAQERLDALDARMPWMDTRTRASAGVCPDLAYSFYLVAERKERGSSKEEQLELLRESIRSPFVADPETTLRHLGRVVDMVYQLPEHRPEEIETKVLANCGVNERGQAVLGTVWPL